jgi:hypothetical protein
MMSSSLSWSPIVFCKAKKILQWWNQRQIHRSRHKAEIIRDSVLQEILILRRHIELSLLHKDILSAEDKQDWLKKLEQLYHKLEQTGNSLAPPYVEESLPLALQHKLTSQSDYTFSVNFRLELPSAWQFGSSEQSPMILMSFEELLLIALSDQTGVIHRVSLAQQEQTGRLEVEIRYPNSLALDAVSESQDLRYLRQSFQLFTAGNCWTCTKELSMTWYFRWHLS